MFKLKVNSIDRVDHQATGTKFLDVALDIIDENDEVVASRKLGFDPEISKEELSKELGKVLSTFKLEEQQKETQKEQDEADEKVAELQDEFVGLEISEQEEE